MNRSVYPMACWTYAFLPSTCGKNSNAEAAFTELLGELDPCIALLSERELFIPSQVRCLNWAGGTRTGHKEKYVDIACRPGARFDQVVIGEVMRQQQSQISSFPSIVEINGWTRLISETGTDTTHERLLSIEVHVNCGDVDIHAHSDAWLPFSFDARSSTDAYEENAARLETALIDLERYCKREATDDRHSRYCLMEGCRLDNYRVNDLPVGIDPDLWWEGR